jgi:hypothetical protein
MSGIDEFRMHGLDFLGEHQEVGKCIIHVFLYYS